MTERSLQEMIDDGIAACRKPVKFGFDPSAVLVCPPEWVHVLEQRILAELQPDVERGECAVVSAEGILLDFWRQAETGGADIASLEPRGLGRLMSYEEDRFLGTMLEAILRPFQENPDLKTCVVTGLWAFYPAVHTSSILSDLKSRNMKGKVVFIYPGVDVDGVYLKLLGIDEGFGYKARRI